MLSCKDIALRASTLIDGELGALEAIQMRLHLAMCKGCRAFIGQMRITRDLTQVPPATPDAADADDGRIVAILARVHAERQGGV